LSTPTLIRAERFPRLHGKFVEGWIAYPGPADGKDLGRLSGSASSASQ